MKRKIDTEHTNEGSSPKKPKLGKFLSSPPYSQVNLSNSSPSSSSSMLSSKIKSLQGKDEADQEFIRAYNLAINAMNHPSFPSALSGKIIQLDCAKNLKPHQLPETEIDLTIYPKETDVSKLLAEKIFVFHGAKSATADNIFLDTSIFSLLSRLFNHAKLISPLKIQSDLKGKWSIDDDNATTDLIDDNATADLIAEHSDMLILAPTFGYYLDLLQNRRDLTIKFFKEDNQKTSLENAKKIESEIRTSKPATFLLVNPANPHNRIFNKTELEIICKACAESKTTIICDEAFIGTTLINKSDPVPSISQFIGEIKDLKAYALYSIGKSCGVEGLRVSALYSSKEAISELKLNYKHLSGDIDNYKLSKIKTLLEPQQQTLSFVQENALNQYKQAASNSITIKNTLEKINKKLCGVLIPKVSANKKPTTSLNDSPLSFADHVRPKFISMLDNHPPNMIALLDFSGLKNQTILGIECESGVDIMRVFNKLGVKVVAGEAYCIDPEKMQIRVSTKNPKNIEEALDILCKQIEKDLKHAQAIQR